MNLLNIVMKLMKVKNKYHKAIENKKKLLELINMMWHILVWK